MLINSVGWSFYVKLGFFSDDKKNRNKPADEIDSSYITEEKDLVNKILSDSLNVLIACPKICDASLINNKKSSLEITFP